MKKWCIVLMTAVLLLALVACGEKTPQPVETPSQPGQAESYKIGILQLVDHEALNAAREGFIQALKDSGLDVEIDVQNAQGDQTNLITMSDYFINNEVDLVMAIATPAAQAIAGKTSKIPILITAVTDPVDARLVQSADAPGTNVTGTNDMNPIAEQMDMMLEFVPQAKTVGFIYTGSEDNSVKQAAIARAYLESLGITVVEQTIATTNDLQQVAQAMVEDVDAIYVPTDNNVASAMPVLGKVATDAGIPVFCGECNMVLEGGLATLGLDYYNLGYQTGEMAVRVLKGEDPATMPIESQSDYQYVVNGATVEALGIEVPEAYRQYIS